MPPIATTDIDFHLSGGAANSDPDASLGGAISNNQIVDAALHNLFDVVSGDESSTGDIEYRCLYIKNAHGSLTMQNTKIWVQSESGSADSDELIGLGTSAIGATEQTIANEAATPVGVSFSQANLEAGSLVIGDIAPGSHKAIWIRRDIAAAAAAANNDSSTIRVKCESAA